MAKKTTITATIQVRRDTTANWLRNKNVVPTAGEPCLDLDTMVVVYGNGTDTYETLLAKHTSTKVSSADHYEGVKQNSETDSDVIERVLTAAGVSAKKGDIFIVKAQISDDKYTYTAYVYNGSVWAAMDGNYSAENVYFTDDLIYTAPVGVLDVPDSGSGTINASGKNVKDVLTSILAKEEYPTITQPTASITLTGAGAKEVGTKFIPTYTANITKGSYQYGPETGVTATAYAISDTNSGTASTKSGSFGEITVGDDTNYKVTATISYGNGAVPNTNLGNSYAAGQIKPGSKTASSSAVTGYRNWYTYVGNSTADISSDVVRAAAAKGNAKNAATLNNVTIPAGTKRIFVALPIGDGYTKRLKSVIDVDGMGLDVFQNFGITTIGVKGTNDHAAMNYNIYCAEKPNGFAATRYNFIIG